MEKRVQDYGKEILNVVRSNVSPAVLAKRLQDFHENDLADVLQELSVVERCKLYRVLDMDTLSDIFEYTEEDDVVKYLEEMEVKKLRRYCQGWRQMYWQMYFSSLNAPKERF